MRRIGAFIRDSLPPPLEGQSDALKPDQLILRAIYAVDYGSERTKVLALPSASAVPKATLPKIIARSASRTGSKMAGIASVNNIAKTAQREVEHYFNPYIKTAGRGAADVYHSRCSLPDFKVGR
jgi:hypothetical protein